MYIKWSVANICRIDFAEFDVDSPRPDSGLTVAGFNSEVELLMGASQQVAC